MSHQGTLSTRALNEHILCDCIIIATKLECSLLPRFWSRVGQTLGWVVHTLSCVCFACCRMTINEPFGFSSIGILVSVNIASTKCLFWILRPHIDHLLDVLALSSTPWALFLTWPLIYSLAPSRLTKFNSKPTFVLLQTPTSTLFCLQPPIPTW